VRVRGARARALVFCLWLGLACAGPVPEDLGVSDGQLAACPSSPNCVSTDADDDLHRTDPFALALPAPEAWAATREVVAALPGTVIVTATDDYIHAEATTPLLRFVDDLELHLVVEKRRIAVRSASRTGFSDMGANRERVWELRRALKARGVVR
jgi:uncharacterized protein (DUF1499 family)